MIESVAGVSGDEDQEKFYQEKYRDIPPGRKKGSRQTALRKKDEEGGEDQISQKQQDRHDGEEGNVTFVGIASPFDLIAIIAGGKRRMDEPKERVDQEHRPFLPFGGERKAVKKIIYAGGQEKNDPFQKVSQPLDRDQIDEGKQQALRDENC